jgi:hypothetical protein
MSIFALILILILILILSLLRMWACFEKADTEVV